MKKTKVSFLLILIILVAGVVLAKDFLIKVGVETAVKQVTGLPLKIDSLKVGITTTKIDIRGLRVFNPPGFVAEPMIDIPEIYVDYSLKDMLTGKVHLSDVRLEVHEFVAVVSKEGALNINYLKTLQEKMPAQKPTEKPTTGNPRPNPYRSRSIIYSSNSTGSSKRIIPRAANQS